MTYEFRPQKAWTPLGFNSSLSVPESLRLVLAKAVYEEISRPIARAISFMDMGFILIIRKDCQDCLRVHCFLMLWLMLQDNINAK